MQRRDFIVAAAVATAGTVSGCLSTAGIGGDDGTANPTGGGNPADTSTIQVVGEGEAEDDPEIARLQIAVEERDEEAEVVRQSLADQSEDVLAALEDAGIDDEDITTARYRLREDRDGLWYEGSHAYDVTVRDIDEVGVVIDTAVAAGADDIGRVHFTLSEETREELREVVLERALEDARGEADLIAAEKDLEIVSTASVSTSRTDVRPFRADSMLLAGGADAAATDIREGPVTVRGQVEVIYRFEE